MPKQEEGLRYARALPYALQATGSADFAADSFTIASDNQGAAGACFLVRPNNSSEGPWTFTVEGGKSLSHIWNIGSSPALYDLSVHGPNGFFRSFKGALSGVGKTWFALSMARALTTGGKFLGVWEGAPAAAAS